MSPTKTLLAGLAASLAAMLALIALPTQAEEAQPTLRVAVYKDFPPYSYEGKGIDVDLAKALAEHLGMRPEVAFFVAGEDMNDDLRNMVWKGHYLGNRPGDLMMHVPVDARLAAENDKVRIFAPYHVESLAVARNPHLVQPVTGSAAVALEVFSREKIGVEGATLADAFLLGVLNGRLASNVVHYASVGKACAGLQGGEVAAVMAPRGELEAALAGDPRFPLGAVKMPELRITQWALGMAVKTDEQALADKLAKALDELEKDGTVQRIFQHYGVSLQTPGS